MVYEKMANSRIHPGSRNFLGGEIGEIHLITVRVK